MITSLEYFQEVSKWKKGITVPNHIYIFKKKECVGYIAHGTSTDVFFNKPSIAFNKKNRKFKK